MLSRLRIATAWLFTAVIAFSALGRVQRLRNGEGIGRSPVAGLTADQIVAKTVKDLKAASSVKVVGEAAPSLMRIVPAGIFAAGPSGTSGRSATPAPLAGLTADQIVQKALKNLAAASSVRITGEVPSKEGNVAIYIGPRGALAGGAISGRVLRRALRGTSSTKR